MRTSTSTGLDRLSCPPQLHLGGYVSETAKDDEAVSPSVAAYAIETYSRPGQLVVDPDCGAGTVLTEAVRAGRHAVGLATNLAWWHVAQANLTAAKRCGAWPTGSVLDLGANDPCPTRMAGLWDQVDLVLTAIRTSRCPDPDSHLRDAVRTWIRLLRPGGRAVVVLRACRSADDEFVDVPGAVIRAAQRVGLELVDRCVAAIATVSNGRSAPHSSSDQGPRCVVAHDTVLVFQATAFDDEAVQAAVDVAVGG